jgi:hypothetical protein
MLIDVLLKTPSFPSKGKDHDRYVVDESETHDRPMKVEAAITDYVNSVKTRAQKK